VEDEPNVEPNVEPQPFDAEPPAEERPPTSPINPNAEPSSFTKQKSWVCKVVGCKKFMIDLGAEANLASHYKVKHPHHRIPAASVASGKRSLKNETEQEPESKCNHNHEEEEEEEETVSKPNHTQDEEDVICTDTKSPPAKKKSTTSRAVSGDSVVQGYGDLPVVLTSAELEMAAPTTKDARPTGRKVFVNMDKLRR